jgi:hypothetical protein
MIDAIIAVAVAAILFLAPISLVVDLRSRARRGSHIRRFESIDRKLRTTRRQPKPERSHLYLVWED